MKRGLLVSLLWITLHLQGVFAQVNTVGVLAWDKDLSQPGYDLLYPDNQSNVYLINQCGEMVHSWIDDPHFRPGNAVYLTPEGRLFKSKRNRNAVIDPIWAGGGGESIEIRAWDNEILYSFTQNSSVKRLHHDFTVLPNGNIVAISWEVKTQEEAIAAGRDSSLIYQGEVWSDYLLEIDPDLDSIVWEWHVWDHLIQDFDPTKSNYGDVERHPELIDVNYVEAGELRSDWLHTNSIDYHPALDQLLISVPHFNEIWIIDHSTTTEEARGHRGGKARAGGDLLYRWGNDHAYQSGRVEDRKLFFQHDANWIDEVDQDAGVHGKISLFNNRVSDSFSTANILNTLFDTTEWYYPQQIDGTWGPEEFDEIIFHPDTISLHSESVSSMQVVPNGNRLILSGRYGHVFELTPGGKLVWEYKIPFRAGRMVEQGDSLQRGDNFIFRLNRYACDFPAFADKSLEPMGYLELNPNLNYCDILTPILNNEPLQLLLSISPNPARSNLNLHSHYSQSVTVQVIDPFGQLLQSWVIQPGENQKNISTLPAGMYIIRTTSPRYLPGKFIKID